MVKKTPRPDARYYPPQTSRSIPLRDYSYRTEESYIDWARRFILFHNKRHPNDMGAAEVNAFLTHLATQRNVAASTQNQALSAILFLYREVLHKEIEPILLSSAAVWLLKAPSIHDPRSSILDPQS